MMKRVFFISIFSMLSAMAMAGVDSPTPTDTIVGVESVEEIAMPDGEERSVVVVRAPEKNDARLTTVTSGGDDINDGRRPWALTSEPLDPDNHDWWYLLKHGRLNLQDTTVHYPKFMKLCVDIYNWGDRTFNSYDTTYVVGTGTRWKAIARCDGWFDSYAMNFYNKMPMRMVSEGWVNVGGTLHYMAVSAGYTFDMSNIIGNKPINHKKFDFGFTCARFNAELYYSENTGGTYMRTFGDYHHGRLVKTLFPGLKLYNWGLNAYYFFNNRKYSQGAAYSFSKYQKKSQGSFILGFSYYNQKLSIDFTELPTALLPYLTIPPEKYNVNYDSYAVIFGYGYNAVLTKNLIFNVTMLPGLGLNHTYHDSIEGQRNLLALSLDARLALTYNIGNCFTSLTGTMDGHWYKSRDNSLFSAIEKIAFNIGVRF